MEVVLDLQSQRLTSAELARRLEAVEHPLALRRLYLSNNELTSLPPSLGRFQNLVLLYASGNRLVSLCSELFQLSQLSTLYLSCNSLSRLPSAIGRLTSLRKLSLHTNQLDMLPTSLSRLALLDVLYLNNNPLPAHLNVNCYGDAHNTAALVASVAQFFRRIEPCRVAARWTVLALGRKLPPELARMMGQWVWTTRTCDEWAELAEEQGAMNLEEDEPHETTRKDTF
jgi:hypothetical protein